MGMTDESVRSGPQSRIPPILLWLVAAAVVLRIVTAAVGHEKKDEGSGLIRWQPREKAASAARSQGRPVLYDFTAAWCPPCRRLDTEGWGDSRVSSLVNDSYLPVRIVDREREDGKNSAPIVGLLMWKLRNPPPKEKNHLFLVLGPSSLPMNVSPGCPTSPSPGASQFAQNSMVKSLVPNAHASLSAEPR